MYGVETFHSDGCTDKSMSRKRRELKECVYEMLEAFESGLVFNVSFGSHTYKASMKTLWESEKPDIDP